MCTYIPFCCCMKNITPKKFSFIALACNITKLILTVIVFFLLEMSAFWTTKIFELVFSIINLILLIIIIINISNGKIYDKFRQTGKFLCIIILILSILIIIYRLGLLILIILLDKFLKNFLGSNSSPSITEWLEFIIPTLFIIALEVIQFLSVNYLYKLISINSNISYYEYLQEIRNVGQVSINITNEKTNQNPQFFPYNNPNQFQIIQQNSETETKNNIK